MNPVSIQGLVKRYGETTAVDGFDLEVPVGACVALLGPNGAGKTSVLRAATCLSPFQGGRIEVLGMDVRLRPREVKARIGLVTQEDTLDVDLTTVENLLVYASYHRLPVWEAARRADELLERFRLSEKRDVPLDALSGGMRRRLSIARALLHEPAVLILDEPTTGLDPHARHAIWERVRSLKTRGVTVLLTTHYMEEAAQLADTVVVMDRARRIEEGAPRDLVRRHAGAEVVEVRRPSYAVVERLSKGAAKTETYADTFYAHFDRPGAAAEVLAGLAADVAFGHRPATLEDVFLHLTGRGLAE